MFFLRILKFSFLFKKSKSHYPESNTRNDLLKLYDISIDESRKKLNISFLKNCYLNYIKFKCTIEVEKIFVLEALELLKEEYMNLTREIGFFLKGLEIINSFQYTYLSQENFKNFLGNSFSEEEKVIIVEECASKDRKLYERRIYRKDFLYFFYEKYHIIECLTNFQQYVIEKIGEILKTEENKIQFVTNMSYIMNASIKKNALLQFPINIFIPSVPINIELNLDHKNIDHTVAYKVEGNSKIFECGKISKLRNENIKNKKKLYFRKSEIKKEDNKIIFDNYEKEKILNIILEYRVNCQKNILFKVIVREINSLTESGIDRNLQLDVLEFIKNKTGDISKTDLFKFLSQKNVYYQKALDYFFESIDIFIKEKRLKDLLYDRRRLYLHCFKESILFEFYEEKMPRVIDEIDLLQKMRSNEAIRFIPCIILENKDYNFNGDKLEINLDSFYKNIPFRIKIVTEKNIYRSRVFQKNSKKEILKFYPKLKNSLPLILEESDSQRELFKETIQIKGDEIASTINDQSEKFDDLLDSITTENNNLHLFI